MPFTVSVIIPVYNVEQYLGRCVQSVLRQTYQDIEIILVNDGSPDKCPEICEQFKAMYDHIKVVHKPNGGLASARNAGLDAAGGDYVFFLDSDDWIDENTLEELVGIAVKYQVDFVRYCPMCDGWPDRQNGEKFTDDHFGVLKEGGYTKDKIINEIFPVMICCPQLFMGPIVSACFSFYKLRFLNEHHFRFDETIKYCEDSWFSSRILFHTSSFYFLDGARYYHYFYNKESITKSFRTNRWDSHKKLIKSMERDFGTCTIFNFKKQISLFKIFLILNALGQRKFLNSYFQKIAYCRNILSDPVAVEAMQKHSYTCVSWKLKLIFIFIRLRLSWILALI